MKRKDREGGVSFCPNSQQGLLGIIMIIILCLLSGCHTKEESDVSAILKNLHQNDIEKIELTGTTGGMNGNYSHTLSQSEKNDFIALLNEVELGGEVDQDKALSNGAVVYYTIYFADKDTIIISPGAYFNIDNSYYEFLNYDDLWEEFIYFNSLG